MNNLADVYATTGRMDLALPLNKEALGLAKAWLGPDHAVTLTCMHNLASSYRRVGERDLAVPLFEETLKRRKATLGPENPQTVSTMNSLGVAYREAGKPDLAIPLLEETLKLREARQGRDHDLTLTVLNNLALAYRDAGRRDLALPLQEEVLGLITAKIGPDHPNTLTAMANLAGSYHLAGRPDRALPLLQQAAAGLEKRKFAHAEAWGIVAQLSHCYELLNQYAQAEVWRRKWLAVLKEKAGAESVAYAGELAMLGSNLLQQKRWDEAEIVLRESLVIRRRKEADAWTTFNTQAMLGAALLGRQKHADAEPLLLRGYDGMKARAAKIPEHARFRLTEALERLVQLHDATNKPDEAAKWRKELEAQRKAAETVTPNDK
jgi:tetratricopeptide (TPR) repeat protein